MIVYSTTKSGFRSDVLDGGIEDQIESIFHERLGHRVGGNEKNSWKNSLQYMDRVLNDSRIPDDAGVFIECQLPRSGKRIDFIVTGQDDTGQEHVVIVELKQWSTAEKTDMDAIVRTRFQHGVADTQHPSYQAWSYAAMLRDYNEVVYSENVSLTPCAYLHNYEDNGVLTDPFYSAHVEKAPLFLKKDARKLQEFIARFIRKGDRGEVMYRIEEGRIRPSKMLADALGQMLKGNEEFILIDEQKTAYELVLEMLRHSEERGKQVLIVEGGPGTGKSVVAINLLVDIHYKLRKTACYVTKNSAPRAVYETKLTGQMTKSQYSNLFKGSGSFIETEENAYDALIVDETHRLNEKSGLYGNMGEHQIKELINASRVTVFFIDEDQTVTLKDVGSKAVIREWAHHYGAEVRETSLPSQFRCNGSDGYLSWLDNTLQIIDERGEIKQTANPTLAGIDYDFRVYDDLNAMDQAIRENNGQHNKSRIVAGYCWDWISKKEQSLYDFDFPEYNFKRKWNLSMDGMLWILKPKSIEEIGCIHTCQGLELDYVGVIIGPDLTIDENGLLAVHPDAHPQRDRALFGWKKLMREHPEEGAIRIERIIKNTYRTLMSRGMKGCYVWSEDAEVRDYLRRRMG